MAATQSASGVKDEPIWRPLPPRAADEEACRKHYVITLFKCLVKVSFGDAGVKFWKLGKKISIECLVIEIEVLCIIISLANTAITSYINVAETMYYNVLYFYIIIDNYL